MKRSIDLILTPTDFSAGSQAAADWAMWLAARLGGRVRLLHVFTTPNGTAGTAPGTFDAVAEAEQEAWRRAEQDLDRLAVRLARSPEGMGRPKPETALVGSGNSTAEAILRIAREEGADLIVMATHGRSGVRRMVLGSVAEQVVRGAECPVLTVR